jgi:signal transduction histidine kinase
MIKPPKPENEKERIETLKRLDILDTEAEKEFDDLVLLASKICEVPISLISLIDSDRQWFKSKVGIDVNETPRELSFCGHAINKPDTPFIIEDSRKDKRFFDNPLVVNEPHVVFYAGIPITTSDGHALGTLCVLDDKPKELSDNQIEALKILSNQAMKMIELRLNNKLLSDLNHTLDIKNKEIERFAHLAAHDLKSPLNSISQIVELISDQKEELSDEILEYVNMVGVCSKNLSQLIAQLLELAENDNLVKAEKSLITTEDIYKNLETLLMSHNNVNLNIDTDLSYFMVNKAVCFRVLHNLVSNAIKYNDKTDTQIDIKIKEDNEHIVFYVSDNGPGIPEDQREKLFKPFSVLSQQDKFGNRGTGIGLASVKDLLERLDCEIALENNDSEGSCFRFNLPKA